MLTEKDKYYLQNEKKMRNLYFTNIILWHFIAITMSMVKYKDTFIMWLGIKKITNILEICEKMC